MRIPALIIAAALVFPCSLHAADRFSPDMTPCAEIAKLAGGAKNFRDIGDQLTALHGVSWAMGYFQSLSDHQTGERIQFGEETVRAVGRAFVQTCAAGTHATAYEAALDLAERLEFSQ